ncbi:Gfo/Idh/MocA family protein [Rhizobium mayense]|uniref:Gfo/Idh/MocA family oxidoreductase n=1 Tax=Rhizobium mayense TaxID=1312184 RepID=A0ABT7JP84_9HYPH|nr:Gfo/Idh/MocA family oxidoreductase [Rhizobium mayense]MDL2398160.1 Gfo/Idh/MocA family oxidoreductase [Rhizobium mayense]
MATHQQTAALKIAVMGAGLIGRRHVEGIMLEPQAMAAAIIDPSSSARDFASAKNIAWFPSFKQAGDKIALDGVIIATPNQLHLENALEAIHAGLPTLVEKPIAHNADAAEILVREAEKTGVPILVGHHRRHNPVIRAAKRVLDDGRLGKILMAHGNFWVAKPDDYFDTQWRREAGGGPILINLIHDVDLFRFFFGEVESVHAMQANLARAHAVEDTVVVVLRFDSGVLATLSGSDAVASPWSWEMTAGENLVFPRQDQLCYQIGGTAGSLSIPQLTLWTNASKPNWLERLAEEQVHFTPADPLAVQLKHFCDVICRKADPLVTGREGLATLRVIEAIKLSAETGQTVHVNNRPPARSGHDD